MYSVKVGMIETSFTTPPVSSQLREPFKRFYQLFCQTLHQPGLQGDNSFVQLVLAKGAVAQGIIPDPFLEAYKKALSRRDSATLFSLLGKMKDYYGYPTL